MCQIEARKIQIARHPRITRRLVLSNIDLIARCTAATDEACGAQLGEAMAKPLAAAVKRQVEPLRSYLATAAGAAMYKKLYAHNKAALPDVAAGRGGRIRASEGSRVTARET